MIVKSESDRMRAIREITTTPLPLRVEISADDKRSLSQNALSHVWYGQIWRQGREQNTVQARRYCKLHFGVPIMRANDKKFRAGWDTLIKPRLDYADKLALMDWWPVTSLMDHEHMTEYLTAVQDHYAGLGIMLAGLDRGYAAYPEAAA